MSDILFDLILLALCALSIAQIPIAYNKAKQKNHTYIHYIHEDK